MLYDEHNVIFTNGYYDVYFPEHPNARKNGCILLQTLVAEKMLGRYLHKEEVVHHKDFNRLNNAEDNLMVFASQSDHAYYHAMIKNNTDNYIFYQKDGVYHCMDNYAFNHRSDIVHNNGRRYKHCPMCDKLIFYESKLCNECYHFTIRKAERPNKQILKQEIRNMTFVQIGKKYNVSDSAIKKWCKYYGLPYRRKDIKQLSDTDWDNI